MTIKEFLTRPIDDKKLLEQIGKKIGKGFESIACSDFVPSARTFLLMSLGMLLVFSLMMVVSASIPYAVSKGLPELKYFWSQLGYMLIALGASVLIYALVPLSLLYNYSRFILPVYIITFALLILACLSPAINGSHRWLSVVGFSFQPAELAKMFMIILLSEYLCRRSEEVRYGNMLIPIARLMVWYMPVTLVLFLQPDFGSIIVLVGGLLAVFWMAGARFLQFLILLVIALMGGALAVLQEEYRRQRIFGFLNPFDDMQKSDYQASRSLFAFARGEWSGVGYSNSIQKLSHLPEGHNDFLLAVTAEELGFFGVATVIVLEFVVILSIMRIAFKALRHNQLRLSYTTFGFSVLVFGHTIINAGMNMSLLPTKGLTMPFFSYGGSAMLFSMIMIAIVLKIDKETPIINQKDQNRAY